MVRSFERQKGVTIANAFQSILNSSKRKPNKIWVDQGSEFYNKFLKKWLKDIVIKMYSTYNEGKSVAAELLEFFMKKNCKRQIKKNLK